MRQWLVLGLVLVACTSAQPEPQGTLELSVTRECCYLEGARFGFQLWQGEERIAGELLQHPPGARYVFVSEAVPPGSYSLVTFERSCGGNCGTLDPPSSVCRRDVTVEAGGRVRVDVVTSPDVDRCPG